MPYCVLQPIGLRLMSDTILSADFVADQKIPLDLLAPVEGKDVPGTKEQIGAFADLEAREAKLAERVTMLDVAIAAFEAASAGRDAAFESRISAFEARVEDNLKANAKEAAGLDAREAAVTAREAAAKAAERAPRVRRASTPVQGA